MDSRGSKLDSSTVARALRRLSLLPDVLALHAQLAHGPHVLPQRGRLVDRAGPLPQPGRVPAHHVQLTGRQDAHLAESAVILTVDDDPRTITQRNEAPAGDLVRTGGPLLGPL